MVFLFNVCLPCSSYFCLLPLVTATVAESLGEGLTSLNLKLYFLKTFSKYYGFLNSAPERK